MEYGWNMEGIMNRQRRFAPSSFATWSGAALGTVCALLALSLVAHASDRLTDEFHKTYVIEFDPSVRAHGISLVEFISEAI